MSERYFSRTALEFNYNGTQIIYKQEQYLQLFRGTRYLRSKLANSGP